MLNKVNSYGLNLQSKCSFLSKTKKLSVYHPASIKIPKKLQKQFLYTNIYMGKSKKDNWSYEGSVSNCTGVLNGPAGSATMLTWYQGNFTGVLNRLAGSEAMPS